MKRGFGSSRFDCENGPRVWATALGALALCLASSAVHAQTRVVVNEFAGSGGSQVRDIVVDLLESHAVEVVSPKVANAQAKKSGAELDTESGRVRVGKKLRLTAFLDGRVEKGKKGAVRVRMTVYGARDGLVVGEMNLSAPKKQVNSELQATFWDQLGPALQGKVSAAPASEPEPQALLDEPVQPPPQQKKKPAKVAAAAAVSGEVEQPAPVADVEADEVPPGEQVEEVTEPSKASALAALDIKVGARFGTRNFEYNDPMPGLRKYGMRVSPNLSLRLRWYPVAHFEDGGVLPNIGLDLRGELLVGVTSTNRAGQKFSTNSHTLGVGLRGRLPISTVELGAIAGYGVHSFSLEGTSKAEPDVPSTGYGFLRFGADMRWKFYDPVYMGLEAAYLVTVTHGEISDSEWFPHVSGDGVEAELQFGWTVSRAFGFEASFGIQRYFMSFDPQPRDEGVRDEGRVAGGAIDQYLSGRLSAVIQL
ncbi:MAG TPA: hypothetical protein VJV78_47500 [Polyangiales bacterium]|nr:hypothetical protein [Polyangiales bacterium]